MGRKKNTDQRRSEIIWALYDCLADQGHEKVSIKAIAARAGLPYGVIHYHFTSKEEIIVSLGQAVSERYRNRLMSLLAQARSDRQEISMALDFIVEELIFDRPLNRVFFNLIQMGFECKALHGAISKMFSVYRQQMAMVLEDAGLGEGRRQVAAALVAMAEGFSLQWMIDPAAITKKEVRRALMNVIGQVAGD